MNKTFVSIGLWAAVLCVGSLSEGRGQKLVMMSGGNNTSEQSGSPQKEYPKKSEIRKDNGVRGELSDESTKKREDYREMETVIDQRMRTEENAERQYIGIHEPGPEAEVTHFNAEIAGNLQELTAVYNEENSVRPE